MLRTATQHKTKQAPAAHEVSEEVVLPDIRDETEVLESELFGELEEQFVKEHQKLSHDKGLYIIDRGTKRPVWSDDEEDERQINLGHSNITKKLRGEEGETVSGKELEEKLRSQFKRIHGTPKWVTADTSQASLLATTGELTQPSKTLPSKKLTVSRCKNLNTLKSAKCAVQSVGLHTGMTVGLVAGYSKSLDLFKVDGQKNKHLHTQHFKNFPVDCAKFATNGTEIILGSKRPFFYTFDLHKCVATQMVGIRNKPNIHYKKFVLSADGEYLGFQGLEGIFSIFSAKDKQIVKCLQHRSRINCSAFLTEHAILTAGHGGFCTLWDTRTWQPFTEFQDSGSLHITAVGHSEKHIALGSESGVVNIYNKDSIYQPRADPLRAVMNLTTDIQNCVFNPSGELLAISSREVKHALRLVNLHTLHCVPNWPTSKTPLSHVRSVAFSPNSGYITIGNAKGKALLYQLTHYPSY